MGRPWYGCRGLGVFGTLKVERKIDHSNKRCRNNLHDLVERNMMHGADGAVRCRQCNQSRVERGRWARALKLYWLSHLPTHNRR